MCVEKNKQSIKAKKVFISYSWSGNKYQERVKKLVDELISKGIEVIVDFYDLKPGSDTYSFMEKMVNDETIDKVLILIDPKYTIKANDKGSTGVSAETQIISPQVYKSVKQNKVIPVIMKKEKTGEVIMPTYLTGRLYIDLSNEIIYSESLEQLIREIFEKPKHKKPALGSPPSYLDDEEKRDEIQNFINSSNIKKVDNEKINKLLDLLNRSSEKLINIKNLDYGINETNQEEYKKIINQHTDWRFQYSPDGTSHCSRFFLRIY